MPTLAAATVIAHFQEPAPDTVVAVAAGSPLALAQTIALVVGALAAVGLFVLFLRVVLEIRGLERDVRSLVRRAEERIGPVMDRAGNVAENADYVTRVVRADVERLAESVERLRARLNQASDRMEERIEEFNALMEVAQSEAEEIFLDTAATVRGVREGTRTMRDRPRGPVPENRSGTTPAEAGSPKSQPSTAPEEGDER